MAFVEKYIGKFNDWSYVLFRVAFGILFFLHGAQKMGWLGGEAKTGFMLFIGISEVLIGLGVIFGVLVRIAALGGLIIMIGAVATVHIPVSISAIQKGEVAWLYLIAFVVMFFWGAGKLSLEKAVLKKELI